MTNKQTYDEICRKLHEIIDDSQHRYTYEERFNALNIRLQQMGNAHWSVIKELSWQRDKVMLLLKLLSRVRDTCEKAGSSSDKATLAASILAILDGKDAP